MDCNTFGLLGGVLNGFLVRGLGWVTPMGMTVRLFEVRISPGLPYFAVMLLCYQNQTLLFFK